MLKQGGPGSVGVAERPFYHERDYIWKYFTELTTSMEQRAAIFERTVEELEKNLASLRESSFSGVLSPASKFSKHYIIYRLVNNSIGALAILKNHYDTFLTLAARVAGLHDDVERLKEALTSRQRTQNLATVSASQYQPKVSAAETLRDLSASFSSSRFAGSSLVMN
jgi:hypothetical protein